jgi:hypothetical protein
VRRADREPAGRSVGRGVLITGIVVGTVIGILALIGLAVSAAD